METKTTFLDGEEPFKKSRERLELPDDIQKYVFYNKDVISFRTLRVTETETHIYWAEDHFTPRFNKKLFYTCNAKTGISFDKQTKDVKFWFGRRPCIDLMLSFYAYMSCDWYNELPRTFNDYFTVSLAKDIAKGKVKSLEDYAIHLSKRSLIFKDIDPKLLLKMIYCFKMNLNDFYISFEFLGSVLKVAKDPSKVIDLLCDHSQAFSYHLESATRKAMCIDEKIDFSSHKVFNTERERIRNLYEAFALKNNLQVYLPF